MDKKEIVSFIEDRPWVREAKRLERTARLLKALGDPQKGLKYIHVAGTNGKGSCCAMLTGILMDAGYKVGTFTSPHLIEYNERFCINNVPISDKDLSTIIGRIKKAVRKLNFEPTVFEILTAIGFTYFRKENADIVVLEVGLGGRYDATNIIDDSLVSVIMNIGLEHTEILGDTLGKIAYEKAGIIREGGHVVAYGNKKEVIDVFKNVCKEKKAHLKITDFSKIKIRKEGLKGQVFDYGTLKNIELSLLGKHQFYNAAVVIDTVKVLNKKGLKISTRNIRNGLKNAVWDARLSVLNEKPLFILDGAHNPQCAQALRRSLPKLLGKKKAVMLYGTLKDKDYESVIDMMAPYAEEFICLTPDSVRALQAKDLAKAVRKRKLKAAVANDVEDGINKAIRKAGEDGVIIAFGSLYLAGDIREKFAKLQYNNQ
ncbi:MAG: bifunctional folylpolyglutamate synthase/dihydrofolate synthase [Erysipelotrichaceae bacterium]|nr:bifunctional folylpolyglutamate synthase/dihydrofolate synthase [Erysipelotrichaceae bacterium]